MSRILLVEDDTMIASGILYALETEGYETNHATRIKDARSLIEHYNFPKGHLDIIKRAAKINDHLIVAVLINSAKHPLFTVEERVAMLQECCKNIPNVTVEGFDGLTVEFAKKRHASVMVRGLRAVTDFENEIQLAQTNHALMPGIETMFLATSIKWSYLSSTIVKEAAYYGSDISKFVTPNVEKAVNEKYAQLREREEI